MTGDRIELRDLRVLAYCGVLDEERSRRQPFTIDVDIYSDLSAASGSDRLDDTVDYGAVTTALQRIATDERFDLMERFAERLCEVVLDTDAVESVTVTVTKVRPPVAEDLASSGVRLHRTRGSS